MKATLAELSARAPGHSVEVRVPPYAAVQVVARVRHRRGTPPALVQLDAATLLRLATGDLMWADAAADRSVRASGERSDLSNYFRCSLPSRAHRAGACQPSMNPGHDLGQAGTTGAGPQSAGAGTAGQLRYPGA